MEGSDAVQEEVVKEKPKAAKKSRKPTGRDSTPDAPSLPVEGSEAVPLDGLVEGVPVENMPKAAKKSRKPKAIVQHEENNLTTLDNIPKPAKKSRKPNANLPLSNPDDIIQQLLNHSDKTPEPVIQTITENKVSPNTDNEDDEETVDINVSSIIINNEEYLIDDEFNLYDIKTNENIGTFINEQLQLNA